MLVSEFHGSHRCMIKGVLSAIDVLLSPTVTQVSSPSESSFGVLGCDVTALCGFAQVPKIQGFCL